MIERIEKKTGLFFVREIIGANLCLANNNDELRDEFKQCFDLNDLIHYMKAFDNEDMVKAPNDAAEFWYHVNLGKS